MKRIVIITLMVVAALLFTMKYAPAQTSDPIVGTWYFELNHKINYDAMIDTLAERGVHRDSVYQHAMYYTSLAAVVISRCESSKMFFSPFENQVMLETNRYNDPTIVDTQWGRWVKISDGRYMVEFKNRIEFYQLNKLTGEFYFQRTPFQISFVGAMLDNNLKMVRKKGD